VCHFEGRCRQELVGEMAAGCADGEERKVGSEWLCRSNSPRHDASHYDIGCCTVQALGPEYNIDIDLENKNPQGPQLGAYVTPLSPLPRPKLNGLSSPEPLAPPQCSCSESKSRGISICSFLARELPLTPRGRDGAIVRVVSTSTAAWLQSAPHGSTAPPSSRSLSMKRRNPWACV
jgi:hypothetical protein